jgi:ABC-type lipoprotein export system ATPase subunit
VERLTKRFRQGNTTIEALRDISLTVARGQFVAVMGASGSGKSTLLHVMAGRIVVLKDGQTLTEFPTTDFHDAHSLAAHYQDIVSAATTQQVRR